MDNADMKPNRWLRYHIARTKARWIYEQVQAGRKVYLSTTYKHTQIGPKELPLVCAFPSGLYVRHGKIWLCYDYATISAR